MKYFYGMVILSSMLLAACHDQMMEQYSEQPLNLENETLGIVYPLSKGCRAEGVHPRSITATFETDWEDQKDITTALGNVFYTPWVIGDGDANLPESFAYDIKKEDGWKLLFHTFSGIDYSAKDRNYMAFYNIRTGILKVFYYLQDTPQLNNGASWEVSFNGDHCLLNMGEEFTDPMNMKQVKYWKGTNFVTYVAKPFQKGWNGFQIPLAYDPTIDTSGRSLDIRSTLANTLDLNMFGDITAYSEGAILTRSSVNPLADLNKKIATLIGKKAEQWISDNTEDEIIHPQNTENTSTRGAIGDAITEGANLIFGKLTASLSKIKTQRSDLEFTTNGTTHLSGTITFESSSPVLSLRVPFAKDLVGELGAWNLSDRPTIYVDPRADYVPNSATCGDYGYKMRGVRGYKYDVVINPQLKPYIVDQWVDIDLIKYWKWDSNAPKLPSYYTDFGTIGNTDYMGISTLFDQEQLLYGNHLQNGSIYREDLKATVWAYGIDLLPMIYVPKVTIHEEKKYNAANIFMKVTLNLVTEIEGKRDTTISTRTFIPKLEWDPYLCSRLDPLKPEQWIGYDNI